MKKKIFSMHVDVDDFLPASAEEKEYMVQMRPSTTFFKDFDSIFQVTIIRFYARKFRSQIELPSTFRLTINNYIVTSRKRCICILIYDSSCIIRHIITFLPMPLLVLPILRSFFPVAEPHKAF